jgi:ArsR family transcriptional regulator
MFEEKDIKEIALMLKALGEPSRLKIFQILNNCCSEFSIDEEGNVRPLKGITVGEVCCKLTGESIITSTISHHLKELRNSGLINMEKKGKNILCSINTERVQELSKYISNFIITSCER